MQRARGGGVDLRLFCLTANEEISRHARLRILTGGGVKRKWLSRINGR